MLAVSLIAVANNITLHSDPWELHFPVNVDETEHWWNEHVNDNPQGSWTKPEARYLLASISGNSGGFLSIMLCHKLSLDQKRQRQSVSAWRKHVGCVPEGTTDGPNLNSRDESFNGNWKVFILRNPHKPLQY